MSAVGLSQTPIVPAQEDRIRFEERISALLTPEKFERVMAAYVFSKYGHRGQFRDDGTTRYFDHTRAVALILIDELKVYDDKCLVMALLHDIREDAFLLSPYRINLNFGKKVMVGINLLTKSKGGGVPYLERMVELGSWRVLLVKACDRIHNLRTLDACTVEKQKKQVQETREYYPALLDRLELLLSRKRKRRQMVEYLREQMDQLCDSYERSW